MSSIAVLTEFLDPQVLGVRGDPAFDEYGTLALSAGETDITVPFLYEKADRTYRFEYLYVTDSSVTPQDIRAVPNTQTELNFTVKLSGAPVGTTCTLLWHVMRPDPLQVNQPLTTGPIYAILPPSQRGTQALIQGDDFVNVVFEQAQPDDDYDLGLTIENTTGDAQFPNQVFAWTVTLRVETGFRLELSGAPAHGYFILRWRAG